MPNQVRSKRRNYRRSRKPSGRKPASAAKKKSRFRRLVGMVFNPLTAAVSALLLLVLFLIGTYFWFEYSDRIDLLLSGEVFTQNAGIYSAPKLLRKGEKISQERLVGYLKTAGYIGLEQKAAEGRSRYSVSGTRLLIKPGANALVDGKRNYRNLLVRFDEKRSKIISIQDTDSEQDLKKASLEPQLLSALASEGDGRRKAISFKDLPPHLVKAITVTEDRSFFDHYGVNLRGIARALWRRYDGEADGSPLENQGGSSITQQLVKNLLLSPERSLERKAREAYMSIILETKLSKEDIFTLYANQIYLGQDSGVSIYGVGEAARIYFGKDVSALTLDESAFIAGIIRSPNRYNPFKNPKRVESRRNQVLDSMLEAKAISSSAAKKAKDKDLVLRERVAQRNLKGMEYFSQFAVDEIPKYVNDPEALQHLRVYTTIDPDLQRAAHEAVTKRLSKLEKYFKNPEKKKKLNAALVAIRPKTGEIVAMIGGKDYLSNQFNRAAAAKRQPGSVFKPFVYAAALDTAYKTSSRVITPATIFKDEKKVFTFNQETYSPNNYGDFFSNKDITVRDALVKSKNTITVDLAMELNIGRIMNLAHKAGLPKVDQAYPSMALGTSEATPLEMTRAYTVFANMGDVTKPIAINRITTGNGRTIAVSKPESKNILRPDVTYIMNDMMKDVINKGTAAQVKAWGFANVEGKKGIAGKTGTSRDGWFAGFTPELVCVVYVGFDDGSDLGMKGSDSAMPIWADFMSNALKKNPEWNADWERPASIKFAEIDTRTGETVRELESPEDAKTASDTPKKNKENESTPIGMEVSEVVAGSIPKEFLRVEMFIRGTVPQLILVPQPEETVLDPTPTPFTTWEEAEQDQQKDTEKEDLGRKRVVDSQDTVSVMICPVLRRRATSNCPNPESKSFAKGRVPKEFCDFHTSSGTQN